MRNHSPDGALAAMCELILRDEAGHVAFHRDRLADANVPPKGVRGLVWQVQFWLFGFAAGTMLWINHRPGLKSIGATDTEFYAEVWKQLRRFIFALRRSTAPARVTAKWAAVNAPKHPLPGLNL
jgi:hypothetical protein